MASLKKEIKDALLSADFEKVIQIAVNNKKAFRRLISLSYDKEDLLCWRAIEAVGMAVGAVAQKDPSAARNIVHRLLWSVSDESGGIGWSTPEMLGEIVINSHGVFADLQPIILSFHEEEPFLRGVLLAMGRMADAGIEPVDGAAELAAKCLDHRDPAVRGIAVWTISRFKIPHIRHRIRDMFNDNCLFKFYENHELKEISVGEMAKVVDSDWGV